MVTPCGFESHLSHQKKPRANGSGLFLVRAAGLERPALRSRAKKCPGDTFLGRGRVPGNRMAVPKDRQAISVISVHLPIGEGSHFILRQQYFITKAPPQFLESGLFCTCWGIVAYYQELQTISVCVDGDEQNSRIMFAGTSTV